ncbi:hypothetical protein Tco_0838882 [Tanacetum coccineum]|uniref:Uncharacterized protein n=1 Tax=Tanacetum coccineum TaxID=301880 RepID=A0ABQ5AP28_9ASTR
MGVLSTLLTPPTHISKVCGKTIGKLARPPCGNTLLDQVWDMLYAYLHPPVDNSFYFFDMMVTRDLHSMPWSELVNDDIDALAKEVESIAHSFSAFASSSKCPLNAASSTSNCWYSFRDDNKTRTRWGPDPQTRIDWGIPELTGDGDGDGESPNYETGDRDNINPRRKIPESPWGSPIPVRDGDEDVNRFPDGDGDDVEKRG